MVHQLREATENLQVFAATIDREMQEQNIYYKLDLIQEIFWRPAVLLAAWKMLINYARSQGKLGWAIQTAALSERQKGGE